MNPTQHQAQETASSIVSYGVACGSAVAGWLCEAADYAQLTAIFFACVIAGLRMIYDGIRLYRYIRSKPPK